MPDQDTPHPWSRDPAAQADMTIAEFCDAHGACREGREWALANCATMREAWATIRPDWVIWIATRPGVLTDRELRLFAVWSVRQVQHLMTDPRSIAALDVAERHANGEATDEELAAACASACSAAGAAACAAAADRAAARAAWAAWFAAGAAWAAWFAAGAAWAAAWAAAGAAAGAAADAARDAAMDGQSSWLRSNTIPRFARQEVTA